MKLPALPGPVGKQAFEKLYSRRDDDRRIPVFGRQACPLTGLALAFVPLSFSGFAIGAVMFDDAVHKVRAKRPPKDGGRLFDNAGEGDDVDDPVELMRLRVFKRKGERGERLAATGRHGE